VAKFRGTVASSLSVLLDFNVLSANTWREGRGKERQGGGVSSAIKVILTVISRYEAQFPTMRTPFSAISLVEHSRIVPQ